ncbi:MAG: DUF2891 domain-containing protein [Jatrophihabitans sp.]
MAAAHGAAVLAAVRREYPNAPRHVMTDDTDQGTPRELHPAFYGCFDWHSAVEMHWALVRMLRLVPDSLDADDVRATLHEHLTSSALQTEADYLLAHPVWERPYGWGWVLALAAELAAWDDPDAQAWAVNMAPLADAVTALFVGWLGRATYPERSGGHTNSAFALTRSVPYARVRAAAGGSGELLSAIAGAAVRWFAADIDYPAAWEPSGADFLSPALAEAELIAELAQPPEEFGSWLDRFLPHLAEGRPLTLFEPAVVSDESDGQIAHLHGLNLHRAYVFNRLADRLGPDDPRTGFLRSGRDRHAAASLPAITGGGWMTEHWLAAYAVLLLS